LSSYISFCGAKIGNANRVPLSVELEPWDARPPRILSPERAVYGSRGREAQVDGRRELRFVSEVLIAHVKPCNREESAE
jgi:hypothetical protein